MGYRRAEDVLPADILEQVQQYVDGDMLYFPRRKRAKAAWGEHTQIKRELAERNRRIYCEYVLGKTVEELAKQYYLAEKSIQRILRQEKAK